MTRLFPVARLRKDLSALSELEGSRGRRTGAAGVREKQAAYASYLQPLALDTSPFIQIEFSINSPGKGENIA